MHAGPHVDVNETTYRQTATQKHAFKHSNILVYTGEFKQ